MKNKSAKSTKTASPAQKSARRTTAAKVHGKTAPRKRAVAARKASAKKTAAKRKPQALSPRAQKKRAMQHFRTLLEEKQLRAAQTPAWRELEHHDHPAPSPPRKI